MGVRGLKTFMENNPGLFNTIDLRDTELIIDANNLLVVLYKNSQNHERRDLFGGDMVQFGRHVNKFFDNLERCNIRPILVFDGAQTYDQNKSKTAEKHRRALDRFQTVMSINKLGFGDFILPATGSNVFRSVSVDREVRMIQCMYEADLEIARISNEFKCPVLSNDSDFFLMNLPGGVITIDLFDYEHLRKIDFDWTIPCSLYKQQHFRRYLPDLDINNLPLLGVLAGNDFIPPHIFEQICKRLPSNRGSPGTKSFRRVNGNRLHEKILRILYFITCHPLNQTINLICSQVALSKRRPIKNLIKSNLEVYGIPSSDQFEQELCRLYWRGFSARYRKSVKDEYELTRMFEEKMGLVSRWLRDAMQNSVLSYRFLELANKNILFIINHMDDPALPSAHECQYRSIEVMLALLKSTPWEKNFCILHDRVGRSYSKMKIHALRYLDGFGKLDYTLYEVPQLAVSIRRSILFCTFYSSEFIYEMSMKQCYNWFDEYHIMEFVLLKILLEFIDILSTARLWKHFRQASLLCMIYYFRKMGHDKILNEWAQDDEFMQEFFHLVKRDKLDRMPVVGKRRQYNCRLMHQITQLQTSIISFNNLNALLGDVTTRIRTEFWLNSCLIYNLAEGLHNKTLRMHEIPEIIHIRPKTLELDSDNSN